MSIRALARAFHHSRYKVRQILSDAKPQAIRAGSHNVCESDFVILEEVIEFFHGKRKLENVLKGGIRLENVIPKAVDFGAIRGQDHAQEAAWIAAASGHNLLTMGTPGSKSAWSWEIECPRGKSMAFAGCSSPFRGGRATVLGGLVR